MTDLPAWLLERIAADEAAALECAKIFPSPWEIADRGWRVRIYSAPVPLSEDVGDPGGWGCGMSEVRGRCSVCGATYAIRRDGMVRHHDNGLIFEGYRVCAGSGRPPTTTPLPNPSTNEGEQHG